MLERVLGALVDSMFVNVLKRVLDDNLVYVVGWVLDSNYFVNVVAWV